MTARTTVPLNDENKWQFRQMGDSTFPWMDVHSMPTNVHLDLLHNGIIQNPSFAKFENDCQWVGETSWIYKGSFPSPDPISNGRAVLAFEGLDTYATVVLNGLELLKSKDMFIEERVDVTQILRNNSENILEITFDSTFLIGKKLVERYPDHHWGCWNGDPSRLAVRKAQFHYEWDWGPALLTCGPWRPICLELYISRISDLYFTTNVEKSLKSAEVVAKADIEGEGTEVKFDISFDGDVIGTEIVKVEKGLATALFKTRKPKLWFPHTYGKQPLYTLSATLFRETAILDVASKRFGLRRAKVVQRKLDDAPGTTFLVEINNIPIFCGGSNWIPADNFTCMIGSERYHEWIQLAVDGNQIMLRAWGGGIFEESAFYEACDEMGVLIWQDFLFACGNYPAYPEFLDLVKREATANVKRLRHHPSIVIWAGNNEDYQYRETENLDYDPDDQNPESWLKSSFPARYIYEKILVDVTSELVPGTYYHFGSPFGGRYTGNPHVGDIHQWNVWHGTQEKYQDFDKLTGRFVSEFGMEAFPSMKTTDYYLIEGTLDLDRYPQSSTVGFHNKAAGHERRLALYLAENIPVTMEPFEQYVYCTQLLQAECLSTAYRLWKRQWKGPGREYCSGALVWQLNDAWPCTSWSIVDHYLRPKMAYYAIKRELQPITLGMKRTIETIPANKYTRADIKTIFEMQVWACNFSLEPCDATFHVRTHHITTSRQREWPELIRKIQLLPNRSTEIADFTIPVFGKSGNEIVADTSIGYLGDEVEEQQTIVATYLYNEDKQIARALNWPGPLKHVHFPKPKAITLQLSHSTTDPEITHGHATDHETESAGEADTVTVCADVPIKGFVVEVLESAKLLQDKVVFEDNGVDLMAGESVSFGVRGLRCGDEDKLGLRFLEM